MGIETIYNFLPLSETLATAGQPTEEQLRHLADAGYEVVINLDVPDSRYALPDEPGLVQSMGMTYHNIPVDFSDPTVEDFERFSQTLEAVEDGKVLVHCAANYRVSAFVALYAQARWNWSEAEADVHIRRLWDPNETWAAFIDRARQSLASTDASNPSQPA